VTVEADRPRLRLAALSFRPTASPPFLPYGRDSTRTPVSTRVPTSTKYLMFRGLLLLRLRDSLLSLPFTLPCEDWMIKRSSANSLHECGAHRLAV
jgi:hypothetical protein